MTTTYRPAPSVARIAEGLIAKHHPDLVENDIRIEYVFRDEAAKKNGKTVMGTARKVSGLNAFLATDLDELGGDEEDMSFFVIEIAEDIWRDLDAAQRTALVDHELCHLAIEFDKEDNLVLKTRAHDLEEFREVIERHGLWQPDVAQFADSVAKAVQLRFETDDAA